MNALATRVYSERGDEAAPKATERNLVARLMCSPGRKEVALVMGEMTTERRSRNPFSHVWSFFVRLRAKRDQEYVAVLSDPCGAKDVHDAKLAHEVSTGRQAQEAARGATLSGG